MRAAQCPCLLADLALQVLQRFVTWFAMTAHTRHDLMSTLLYKSFDIVLGSDTLHP